MLWFWSSVGITVDQPFDVDQSSAQAHEFPLTVPLLG
jgi:hypothetical protein